MFGNSMLPPEQVLRNYVGLQSDPYEEVMVRHRQTDRPAGDRISSAGDTERVLRDLS